MRATLEDDLEHHRRRYQAITHLVVDDAIVVFYIILLLSKTLMLQKHLHKVFFHLEHAKNLKKEAWTFLLYKSYFYNLSRQPNFQHLDRMSLEFGKHIFQ